MIANTAQAACLDFVVFRDNVCGGAVAHHSGPCENSTGVGRTVINIPKDAPWRVESDALVGFCRKPSFGSKNGDLQLKIGLF